MMREELLQDIKALAGIPLFGVLCVVSFVLGFTDLLLQLIIGFVLSFAVTIFFRVLFFRNRPKREKFTNFVEKIDASSFPSLHAMRAGVLAVIAGSFLGQSLLVFFVLCAVCVAIARVLQKRHHVSDVIVGLVLGTIIGYFAVWLF